MRRLGIGLGLGLGLRLPNLVYPGGGFVDIVSNGVLAPFVTFTRASEGTYFDSAGTQQTAAANEPRIDYDPVTLELRGLLIEEQRTNLLLRSQEFDDSTAWSLNNVTVTPNGAIAPNGTLTADILTATATASTTVYGAANATATSMTYSIYTKKGTRTTATFLLRNHTTGTNFDNAVFDYDTGTITGTGWAAQNVGNGWYRLTYTRTTGITAGDTLRCYIGAGGGVLNAGDSWLLWGAQLEAGTFATSYIPTAGTAQTRAADVASAPLSSIGWNGAESTLFAEYIVPWSKPGATRGVAGVDSSGRFIYFTASSDLVPIMYDGTTNVSTSAISANAISKTISAFSSDGMALCSNGGAVNTAPFDGSFGSSPTVLRIGESGQGGSNQLCGHIRRLRYYPRRLTNAQLQALTA